MCTFAQLSAFMERARWVVDNKRFGKDTLDGKVQEIADDLKHLHTTHEILRAHGVGSARVSQAKISTARERLRGEEAKGKLQEKARQVGKMAIAAQRLRKDEDLFPAEFLNKRSFATAKNAFEVAVEELEAARQEIEKLRAEKEATASLNRQLLHMLGDVPGGPQGFRSAIDAVFFAQRRERELARAGGNSSRGPELEAIPLEE